MRHNIIDPTDRGRYVDALWQAVKAQLIDWRSCQAAQSAAMPTCDCCKHRPSIVSSEQSARYLCTECYTAGER